MPELPWKKWFPQDWLSDPRLARCSPSTRGIWADAVSSMMLSEEDHITGSDSCLARICRCSESDIGIAHKELEGSKTCEVSIQNGYKFWVCRRIRRELSISQIRKSAVGKRWNKGNTNGDTKGSEDVDTNSHTRSASASISVQKRRCTEEESVQFCLSQSLTEGDGHWFFDKCEGNGWKNSGKSIVDWQATIRSWKRVGTIFPSQKQNGNGHNGHKPDRQMSAFEIEKRTKAIAEEINTVFKRNGSKRVEGDGIDELKNRRNELQRQLVS